MLSGVLDPYFYGRMRAAMPVNDPMHAVLAPLEHREFVRETVGRRPAMAVPMAGAIPVYSLLKLLRMLPRAPHTSPASIDEVFAGYEGLFGGLHDAFLKPK